MSPSEALHRQRFEHTIALAAINFGVQGFAALSDWVLVGPIFSLFYALLVWRYTRWSRKNIEP